MTPDLAAIAAHFSLDGPLVEASPYGAGHIHRTYAIRCAAAGERGRRYLLQAINTALFREPEQLMANIERITRHLREKIRQAGGDPAREALTLIPTRAGATFHRDAAGGCWRAFLFIERAQAHEMAISRAHVYHAARAIGRFQRMLADFPAGALHPVLPDFHHTPRRLAFFWEAVAADRAGRAAGVQREIRFIEQRAAGAGVLVDLLAQGRLPLRVTHNDAKFSNVLLDDATGEGLCVIDLDTVMPGTALVDFADAVRSGAALAAEDEPDASRAGLSLQIFDALAHGYLDAGRDFLTPAEIEHLPAAARVITLEQAIRFLGDHLNGDSYYRVQRAGQNLDRARTQLRMVEEMEDKFGQMEALVERYR